MRYLTQQEKTWDLMAWGFTCGLDSEGHCGLEQNFSIKSVPQLQQEAAATISQEVE